jgi:hypothetical protein
MVDRLVYGWTGGYATPSSFHVYLVAIHVANEIYEKPRNILIPA